MIPLDPEPFDEDAVYQSASQLVVEGNLPSAVEKLTLALELNPNAGRLWQLKGQAHLTGGQPSESVHCLEHASCLTPLSMEGRFALAHAYELTGRTELAGDLFGLLADVDDLPLAVLEPLASALGRLNKPALALGVCTQAAARMPGSSAPLLGMAFYQRRLGFEPERTLPVLFQALHLDPEDFDLRLTLARMLHECGQPCEAAELLCLIEIKASRCPSCLAAMQQIFEEAGDAERATRCLDALVDLAGENDG